MRTLTFSSSGGKCRNLSVGLVTKARVCKVASQKRKPENERKCEGMNLHTPKGISTLGVGIMVDSRMFREQFQGSKLNGLKSFLYHWKFIETQMFKMSLYDPFGHLNHKLWPKERLGIKLAVWFLTIKSQESTRFPYVKVVWEMLLESSRRKLQLCFRLHLNWRSTHKVMGLQSHGSPNFGNFGIPIWESRDKMPFGCGPYGEARSIL